MPVEKHGPADMPCVFRGFSTYTLTLLTGRGVLPTEVRHSISQGLYNPAWWRMSGFPAMGEDLLWDGACRSPVVAWAPCPGPCCGLLMLSCCLALSHVVSSSLAHAYAPFLWHFHRSFIIAVAALHQARFWNQWVSQVFLLPAALAGCWHPPLALQHPGYPSMGVLQPMALPGLPSKK